MTEDVLNWIKKEKLMTEGDTVIVGLSGGADSVALLLVLLELRQRIGYTLLAIHVEHGIRGEESRKDAAFVEELCRQKNIPCRICPVNVPDYAATEGIGVEEAARILRYECYQKAAEELKQSGAGRVSIALAHHANDNAETVLFQMARGSGVHGMCGMHPKRVLGDDILIVRPLLCVSRGQIEEYLKKCGQEYRTDGTNLDINYSRNRIRHHILPELSVINEQAVSHINQSALLLQQAVSYMEQETKKAVQTCCIGGGGAYVILENEWKQYPEIIRQEIVHEVLGKTAGSRKDLGMVHVQDFCALMEKQTGREITLPYQMTASRIYEGVRLCRRGTHKAGTGTWQEKGGCETEGAAGASQSFYEVTADDFAKLEAGETVSITLPDANVSLRLLLFSGKVDEIPKNQYTKWLNYDRIECGLQFRRRASGDYLTVDDAGHKKKLKSYFIDEKIPQIKREHIWLLAQQSHVLWVIGGRISAVCKIKEDTKKILEVRIDGGNYRED